MRQPYKRVFKDEKKLAQMLLLRSEGVSFLKLGTKYRCDHSSIIYQVKKHGTKIRPEFLKIGLLDRRKATTKYRYYEVTTPPITERDRAMGVVKINQGKDYVDYLKANNMRLVDLYGWKIEKKKIIKI